MTERLFGEIVHEVETVAEEFLPKPGGAIDRFRQEEARRREAEKERENIDAKIEAPSYKAVKTATQSPEVFSAQTFTIAAGSNAMVLPLSKYRYRATITLVPQVTPVSAILAKDQGAAIGLNGFILQQGLLFTTNTRGQVWVQNTNAATIQVSVAAEIYAPEARM